MSPQTDAHWNDHPAVPSGDQRTLGERAADAMRAGMGSWAFIFAFVIAMCIWAAVNVLAPRADRWDVYPFILLNLMLSTLAGLQGGILLIAAKRADKIAAAVATHTAENTDRLVELLAQNTALTEALHAHIVGDIKGTA